MSWTPTSPICCKSPIVFFSAQAAENSQITSRNDDDVDDDKVKMTMTIDDAVVAVCFCCFFPGMSRR